MKTSQLDHILKLQLVVAWAGESADPPRLGWWRTDMCDKDTGEDLLRRLTPRTWQWATLETCRAAAKRVDDTARQTADDPDRLLSLYRLGFDIDEHLDERLVELKQAGRAPAETFPDLADLLADWSKEPLESLLRQAESVAYTTTPTGRRLKSDVPTDPTLAASQLAGALLPLKDRYPLPHFRLRE